MIPHDLELLGNAPAPILRRLLIRFLLACAIVVSSGWLFGFNIAVLSAAPRHDAPPSSQVREPEGSRPLFHFTPPRNFINDPNGLVFADGEYHLFYQHNPEGDRWGHMSWGHATSRDLLRRSHLPIALREQDGVMIFSGSAVFDRYNTSGLGKPGTAPLIAIYTGDGNKKQTQNIASSVDRGRTWTKFSGNPVVDLNSNSFRDPKVFWHQPSQHGSWRRSSPMNGRCNSGGRKT